MIMKAPQLLLATIAVLLFVPASAVSAQQPAAPSPPAPRPPRAPRPDKPFELHALTPEFWKLFDKDAKLETMGTGFRFTITNHTGDDQAWVVECGPESMAQRVAQFAAFVNRPRRSGRNVAGNSAGE